MTGGNRVVAIGPGSSEAAGEEFLLTEELAPAEAGLAAASTEPAAALDWDAEPLPPLRSSFGRAELVGALAAVAAWTGLFIWAQTGEPAASSNPAQWAAWIRDWSIPVLLIAVMWLLDMRNSKQEAARFGQAARLLSEESGRLEVRLASVNGELSLAREFIASQTRDLEALGRVAVERLTQSAERMQSLIQDNSRQVEVIGTVSEAALDNMEKLRGQLPVIANSARDITSNIGNAGRTAHAQLQELINGFKRLNEFGQASERQVDTLRGLVATTLNEFTAHSEDLARVSETRFVALSDQGARFRGELDQLEAEALAATRHRIEQLSGEIGQTRDALDNHEAESLVSLRARLSALREECGLISKALRENETRAIEDMSGRMKQLDDEIQVRRQSHQEQTGSLAAQSESIAARMAELEGSIARIAEHSRDAETGLAGSVENLAARLTASREALTGVGAEIDGLTQAGARLLEMIETGSRHSREEIPQALADAEARLGAVETRFAALRTAAEEAGTLGEQLHGHFTGSKETIAETARELAALSSRIATQGLAHGEMLDGLRASLGQIDQENGRLAEQARTELAGAIAQLSGSAREAIAEIEAMSETTIGGIAEKLGRDTGAAVTRALEAQTAEAAGNLERASSRAAEVSREAAIQLRDQLALVNELAGNLERRVAQARERAEEQVDNDFSRRMALINESLNSNAIDIARALDSDVTDTAWDSYLKGDRGIFARRAVKLLETGEAKPILQLYEADRDFHDHVSRYIHDFEAMLRQVLSTRDGNALGVTLLSSNIGKLYVALAQAIERLRA